MPAEGEGLAKTQNGVLNAHGQYRTFFALATMGQAMRQEGNLPMEGFGCGFEIQLYVIQFVQRLCGTCLRHISTWNGVADLESLAEDREKCRCLWLKVSTTQAFFLSALTHGGILGVPVVLDSSISVTVIKTQIEQPKACMIPFRNSSFCSWH